MSKFPVPVSGEKIPHGWFANLVRFVNSLTLRGDGRYTMVSRNESGTTVTLTPAVKNAIERSGGTPGSTGGASHAFVPDYSSPTTISSDTQYGPFAYPVWLIGSIGALLYDSNLYEAYLSLGSTSTSITLFDITQTNGMGGYQITQLIVPVSILIPASTSFTVHTQTTEPSNFDINLNYYPLIQQGDNKHEHHTL